MLRKVNKEGRQGMLQGLRVAILNRIIRYHFIGR